VIDLNRILMYADREGHLQNAPARRMFSIVDGIIGGEGNGPLDPRAKAAGVVCAGANMVCVDVVCAHMMGFDCKSVPLLDRSFDPHLFPLVSDVVMSDVVALSNDERLSGHVLQQTGFSLAFQPSFGWSEHIERTRPSE